MTNLQNLRVRIGKLTLLNWLLIAGIVWLVAALVLWWNVIYMSPERVFKDMLKNNFATRGFTRETVSGQQNVNANELARIQLGQQNLVRTLTTLKQQNDTVVTDAISTPEQEFIRYLQIDTNRKGKDGKQLDFSSAVNVWAKSDASGGTNQAMTQMLFGIMPIGYVPAEQRAELINFMEEHKVFSVKYDSVKKETIDGRLVYTYQVQLLPQPYIDMLKSYGTAIGFGEQVAALDPADYADAQPSDLTLTVDVLSRQMIGVSFGSEGNERKETFKGYGIVRPVELPTKTITSQELQQRLSTQ